MNKKAFLLIGIICSVMTVSFTGKKKPTHKSAMKSLMGFCSYIPSGTTQVDESICTVQSFYMSSTEITNFQYAEFLADLERTGDVEGLAIAAIDTAAWMSMNPYAYYDPYSENYHVHPYYGDYPVVNISKDAADLFCVWLTKKYDSLSNGELKLLFTLPTRAEWIHAANGGLERASYSGEGPYIRNAKGEKLANYLGVDAENVTRDSETGELKVVERSFIGTSDGAYITAPVKSYAPNGYGLYEMNGNVAEMLSDGQTAEEEYSLGAYAAGGSWNSPGYDIRNQSYTKFYDRHPTVGFRVVARYVQKAN